MKKLKAVDGARGSPIADGHFAEARDLWKRWNAYRAGKGKRPEPTETSWIETAGALAERGYDLSAKNPAKPEGEKLPPPAELTAMLLERSREFGSIVERIQELLGNGDAA
jgi:type I restriction enzyme M protein